MFQIYNVISITHLNDSNIHSAVNFFLNQPQDAYNKYGNISKWNTSSITSFKNLFSKSDKGSIVETFNADISNWNTQNVVSLESTFSDCRSFNQNLNQWNVSKVQKFRATFWGAVEFNQDLYNWDVSHGNDFFGMFMYANNFNGNISNWNTDNALDMMQMFFMAHNFNSDISNWDVSRVWTMQSMFYHARTFNRDISKWDVVHVVKMPSMFQSAQEFNQDLSSWKVIKTNDMNNMFLDASNFNQTLLCNYWGTSPAKNPANNAFIGTSGGKILCCIPGTYYTANTCKLCPSGKYQSQDLVLVTQCLLCKINTFSPQEGASSCGLCQTGRFSKIGQQYCSICPNGYYQTTYLNISYCVGCLSGKFQDNAGKKICKNCPSGYSQFKVNQSFCISCMPGKFQEISGTSNCKSCLPGFYQNTQKSIRCNNCPKGFYQLNSGYTYCLPCYPGYYQNEIQKKSCKFCPIGYYQYNISASNCITIPDGYQSIESSVAQTNIISCNSGKYGKNCKNCPRGYIRALGENPLFCKPCTIGKYQNYEGKSECSNCISGKYTYTLASNNCKLCPNGFIGNSNNMDTCIPCISGKYQNKKGKTDCISCELGKYIAINGSSNCKNCPFGYYRSISVDSNKCVQCGKNTYSNAEKTTCITANWTEKHDCQEDQYLDDSSLNKYLWNCKNCPDGSSCRGNINATGIMSKYGWSRCPILDNTFEKCSFEAACQGAINVNLRGRIDREGKLYTADVDYVESCHTGYKNDSVLCSNCENGYSISNLKGKCSKCPLEEINYTLASFGILGGILCVILYVKIILHDAGKVDVSDGIKSIGLSYIQITTLLSTFPILWPDIFISIFRVGGAVTAMGQHTLDLKCMFPENTEADVFFFQLIFWSVVPIIIVIISVIVWKLINKCMILEKITNKIKTSIIAILYLVWPMICSETFSLFSCRYVCENMHFNNDLNIQCWQGIHLFYVLLLGIPVIVLWILGLPLIALIHIIKLHHTSKIQNVNIETLPQHLYLGLIYAPYDPKVYWWEITVAFRKVIIASIGVFGITLGVMQVHLSSLLIILTMFVTAFINPYESKLLQVMEQTTNLVTWLTLWSGSVFNVYPRCNDSKGNHLVWCDVLSVLVGICNIFFFIIIVCLFIYIKDWHHLVYHYLIITRKFLKNKCGKCNKCKINCIKNNKTQNDSTQNSTENVSSLENKKTEINNIQIEIFKK